MNLRQKTSLVTSNTSELCPFGVLYFTNYPMFLSKGETADDGWFHLGLPATNTGLRSFCSLVYDLCYLVERDFVRLTYKLVALGVIAVRVYVVPGDIDGYRFLIGKRVNRGKSQTWHDSVYKKIVMNLITVLDYKNWNITKLNKKHSVLIFDTIDTNNSFTSKNLGVKLLDQDYTDHITRLINREEFRWVNHTTKKLNLIDFYKKVHFKPNINVIESVEGIKTPLFEYQRETITQMAINETTTQFKPLPHFIKFGNYYLNIINFQVLRNPEVYQLPQGGILAENMGLGKTLICLGLIMLTKFEISQIPEDLIKSVNFQSLKDNCVSRINQTVGYKMYENCLPNNLFKDLESSPQGFSISTTVKQNREYLAVETFYYQCCTTLVIVPDNLLTQWTEEVVKHCDGMKIGGIDTALKMIKNDVVLVKKSEFNKQNIDSPLFQVYWKRLIIDEGDGLIYTKNSLNLNLNNLKVERRWCVSGTPTSGLTNIDGLKNNNVNLKEDLTKLGNIIKNYLRLEPWYKNPEIWNKYLRLIEQNENFLLFNLLNNIIIRHDPKQIEIKLPKLVYKPVLIHPSKHNKISLNLFISVLVINSISSERVDKDYMFYESNKNELKRLIENLQRSTFFWTGFKANDLKTVIDIAEQCLKKKREGDEFFYNESDRMLLSKSIECCKQALNDETWLFSSNNNEMVYSVSNLHPALCARFGYKDRFIGNSLFELQRFYFMNRFSSDESVCAKLGITWDSDGNSIIESSREARIVGACSNKMIYLVKQLVEFKDCKCIIFYEFEEMAYYLTELLDLIGIEYLLYSTSVSAKQRDKTLQQFKQPKRPNVLIMDLKLASHGLNITEASRVYFMSPVWKKSVEAQAIKRAHRIGQTTDVSVEVLIMRESLEEEIFRRQQNESFKLIDDLKIKEFLLEFKFIKEFEEICMEFEMFNVELIDYEIKKKRKMKYEC